MMQESLLSQGLDLLLYGMGVVCVFLALLVVTTTLMSRIMVRYFPEPLEDRAHSKKRLVPSSTPTSGGAVVDNKTLAIIQAAIQQHRQK